MCAKVSLTLGESKTKIDLTLESKGDTTLTIDDATWTIDSATSPIDNPRGVLSIESKTKGSLTLESK